MRQVTEYPLVLVQGPGRTVLKACMAGIQLDSSPYSQAGRIHIQESFDALTKYPC